MVFLAVVLVAPRSLRAQINPAALNPGLQQQQGLEQLRQQRLPNVQQTTPPPLIRMNESADTDGSPSRGIEDPEKLKSNDADREDSINMLVP